MSFNLGKCKVMHVGTHNPAHEYFMRGVRLEETEEERDIGVAVTKTSSLQHNAAKQQDRRPLSSANLEEISTTGTGTRS
jgi:hypothetical protein